MIVKWINLITCQLSGIKPLTTSNVYIATKFGYQKSKLSMLYFLVCFRNWDLLGIARNALVISSDMFDCSSSLIVFIPKPQSTAFPPVDYCGAIDAAGFLGPLANIASSWLLKSSFFSVDGCFGNIEEAFSRLWEGSADSLFIQEWSIFLIVTCGGGFVSLVSSSESCFLIQLWSAFFTGCDARDETLIAGGFALRGWVYGVTADAEFAFSSQLVSILEILLGSSGFFTSEALPCLSQSGSF